MHGMAMQCWRCSNVVLGPLLGAEKSSGDVLPAPGDYRTGISEGECHVFGMLEGGGGYVGSVFVFVVFF